MNVALHKSRRISVHNQAAISCVCNHTHHLPSKAHRVRQPRFVCVQDIGGLLIQNRSLAPYTFAEKHPNWHPCLYMYSKYGHQATGT